MASKSILALLILALALFAFASAQEVQITPAPDSNPSEWYGTIFQVEKKSFAQMLYVVLPNNEFITEVVVSMQAINSQTLFDPDLYVKLGAAPTKSSYDGSDASTAHVHSVTLRHPPHNFVAGQKIYIGVYAFSTVGGSFQIRVNLNKCHHHNCGGETRGHCVSQETGQHACECKPGYTFQPDCNANDITYTPGQPASNTLLSGQIQYYRFSLPARQAGKKYWFSASIDRTSGGNSAGSVIFAIAKGNSKENVPTSTHNVVSRWLYNYATTATILLDDETYSAGDWMMAVINNSRGDFGFNLRSEVFNCKNKCSGNGECQANSTCKCNDHYTLRDDCSVRSDTLEFNAPQTITIGSPFTDNNEHHFEIHITKAIADPQLEVGVHLMAIEPESKGGNNWPIMYVNTHNTEPTPLLADFESAQPSSWNQTLYLPDTRISEGTMHLAIYGQYGPERHFLLSIEPRPHCPTGCAASGHCGNFSTECICFEGHIGGSCDLTKDDCLKIRNIKTGVSFGTLALIFFLVAALAAGVAAFIFAKFFYVAPASPVPEMNYDPLAN